MANLKSPKSDEEMRRLTPSVVRKEYGVLATEYNNLTERKYVYCHKCDEFLSTSTFYSDANYASGYFPICKKCILKMVEQRNGKNDTPNETKESVQAILRLMDLPYDDEFYCNCVKGAQDGMKERNKRSPFAVYITCLKSLPNWKDKTWKDSEFGDEENESSFKNLSNKAKEETMRRFGDGYTDAELKFLHDEYKDWTERYECNSKSLELMFQRIVSIELDIRRAQKAKKPTKDYDKSLQDLMDSAAIKPKQLNNDNFVSDRTFGQLIRVWENEKPIPKPDPEFEDIDKIGHYISVYFLGHLCKMLNISCKWSRIYEEEIAKYTVKKPEYQEDSEALFETIFGGHLAESDNNGEE